LAAAAAAACRPPQTSTVSLESDHLWTRTAIAGAPIECPPRADPVGIEFLVPLGFPMFSFSLRIQSSAVLPLSVEDWLMTTKPLSCQEIQMVDV